MTRTYVMSWRDARGLRLRRLRAASLTQAFERAFDLAQRLGGPACGFGVRSVGRVAG